MPAKSAPVSLIFVLITKNSDLGREAGRPHRHRRRETRLFTP